MKSNKDKLIKELRKKDKLSDNHIKSEKKFIGSAVFVDEFSEHYVDTRVRMYKKLKRKTSMAIPPDQIQWNLPLRGHVCKDLRGCIVASKTFNLIQKYLGESLQMANKTTVV